MLLTSKKLTDLQALSPIQLNTRFLEDVLTGLNSSPKKLEAKYFYDKTGDLLFQKIMGCQEYYVTRAEAEIFQTHGGGDGLRLSTFWVNYNRC